MDYLIVTLRSLIWMILSLLSTFLMLSALLSPTWLTNSKEQAVFHNETITYTPSVGMVAKCSRPIAIDQPSCTLLAVTGFQTDSSIFPNVWKAATIFVSLGTQVIKIARKHY